MRARGAASPGRRARPGLLPAVLVSLAVTAGAALALQPFAVEALSADALRASSVSFVEEVAADLSAEEAVRLADEMNRELARREQPDVLDEGAPQGYWEWPGVDSRGRMATVEAPGADLCVPVWRGTSEADLSRGAGHLAGTSLPVGGPGTRCVLVGHTDYQGQTLFSHISRLEPGDEVRLTSAAGTLVYRVKGMRVIEPDDLASLAIEPGADVLTLLTCWPPSVNTRRLIVDCERDLGAGASRAGSAELGEAAWWRTGRAACALCGTAAVVAGALAFAAAGGLGRRQGGRDGARGRRGGHDAGLEKNESSGALLADGAARGMEAACGGAHARGRRHGRGAGVRRRPSYGRRA